MARRLVIAFALIVGAAPAHAGDWTGYVGVAAGESWGTIRSYRGSYDVSGSYGVAGSSSGQVCPNPSVLTEHSMCRSPRSLASMSGSSNGVNGGLVLGLRRRAGPVFEVGVGGEGTTMGPPSTFARRLELSVGLQGPEAWEGKIDGWRAIPSVAVGAGWGTVYKTHDTDFDYLHRDGYTVLAALRYDFRREWALARFELAYRALLATRQVWQSAVDAKADGSGVYEFSLGRAGVSHEVGFRIVLGVEVGG